MEVSPFPDHHIFSYTPIDSPVIIQRACNFYPGLGAVFLSTGGTYDFNNSDRLTTVTELSAMANAASSGLNIMPKEG